MAKDGTVRGGARAGAGRKSKALADKIIEGKAELDNGAVILSEPTSIEGVDKIGRASCRERVFRAV